MTDRLNATELAAAGDIHAAANLIVYAALDAVTAHQQEDQCPTPTPPVARAHSPAIKTHPSQSAPS